MYVLSVVQILVLMMLGWRMRNAAVREVLRRPCVLIAAILCQAMLMPLVRINILNQRYTYILYYIIATVFYIFNTYHIYTEN